MNEILKSGMVKRALKSVKYLGTIIVIVDTVQHGYNLYKEYIKPRIKKTKKEEEVANENVNEQ